MLVLLALAAGCGGGNNAADKPRQQRRVSGVMAGQRGTQLCGASQVLSDLRRELFQRQPVS